MTDCTKPLFSTGRVIVTKGVAKLMKDDKDFEKFCWDCLHRHVRGDWGEMDDDDRMANDSALHNGESLLSIYILDKTVIWIITEWDRSVTTILFPEER